jgi:hypothetical protein
MLPKQAPIPFTITPVHFALVILEMGEGLIYLPRLASNHDPPYLSLPSSKDYRCEPLAPR